MIATELATWGTGPLIVPAPVREAALRHLLDGVGSAIGGIRSGTVRPAVDVALGLGGPEEATVLGTTARIGAPAAALANGALLHALDFDDTHAGGLVHATAVVLPAAFAVGEQVGATGQEVLDAAVVGYETVCRVAMAAPHGFHAGGLHATAVAGVFSSALVAARLLGLDAERTAHALGIAGSQAGGLLAFLGTGASTKQLHPGFASQSGILAARLAAAGATGPVTVFDGPHGVYDALATGPVDRSVILAGLGESWETTRIGIKPYPACQLSHATLDAVRDADGPAPVRAGRRRLDRRAGPPQLCADGVPAGPRPGPPDLVVRRQVLAPVERRRARRRTATSAPRTFEEPSISRPEVADLATRVTWELTAGEGHAADAAGRGAGHAA